MQPSAPAANLHRVEKRQLIFSIVLKFANGLTSRQIRQTLACGRRADLPSDLKLHAVQDQSALCNLFPPSASVEPADGAAFQTV